MGTCIMCAEKSNLLDDRDCCGLQCRIDLGSKEQRIINSQDEQDKEWTDRLLFYWAMKRKV